MGVFFRETAADVARDVGEPVGAQVLARGAHKQARVPARHGDGPVGRRGGRPGRQRPGIDAQRRVCERQPRPLWTRHRPLTAPLPVALPAALALALQGARVAATRAEAGEVVVVRPAAAAAAADLGQVARAQAGLADAQVGRAAVFRGAVLFGDDAVPEGGVVVSGARFKRRDVERIQQFRTRRRRPRLGVDDLRARQDGVDVFFDERAVVLVARRVVLFEDFFRAETQDGRHVVPGEGFGGGRVGGGQGGGGSVGEGFAAAAARAAGDGVGARSVHALNDEVVEHHFLLGPLQDVFLDRPGREEAVDVDRLRLPDAVRARHRLEIVLRVPVRVEDDDRVGGGQVDAWRREEGRKEGWGGGTRVRARTPRRPLVSYPTRPPASRAETRSPRSPAR